MVRGKRFSTLDDVVLELDEYLNNAELISSVHGSCEVVPTKCVSSGATMSDAHEVSSDDQNRDRLAGPTCLSQCNVCAQQK